jgi:hypothetical protein
MSQKVNLDALIPRADFETDETASAPSGRPKDTLSVNDLKKGEFFFSYLRKPDFQRETSEWDPKKICNLIQSFLNDDLIPAVILWRSEKNLTFVIDGSHRISALAAWVNDDYGGGEISKSFFDSRIPEDQIEHAEKTRKLVEKEIGSFGDYKLANTNPEKVRADIVERARKLGALAIQLQWVNGSALKAEESFFTINQQASPINQTELKILRARKQPYGVATRAIFRAGQGHKYWADYTPEMQGQIEELSKEIHELLFIPRLKSPIKTLDIPVGGKLKSANALALVLDFVCIANGIKIDGENASVTHSDTSKKDDGETTLRLLKRCHEVARRVNSTYPSSLGLHPVVYFYSKDGVHKVASFYAAIALVIELEKKNSWNAFVDVRKKFESFLLANDELVQQIVRKHRGALASHEYVRDFFLLMIRELSKKNIKEAVEASLKDVRFSYLKLGEAISHEFGSSQDFSREAKSRVFLSQALSGAPTCAICGGYLHVNSITTDHIERKSEGGAGSVENGQLAHPYCNSTYKH